MHSPEFPFEKDAGNVARAIHAAGLRYPVVQDNDLKTWQAWGNEYWPAEYLVDQEGRVRYTSFGEGDYDKTESAIRTLLGAHGAMAHPRGVIVPSLETTPETYVGAARAQGFAGTAPVPGTRRYRAVPAADLQLSRFTLGGTWRVSLESATAVRDADHVLRLTFTPGVSAFAFTFG